MSRPSLAWPVSRCGLIVFSLIFICVVPHTSLGQIPDVDKLQMKVWASNGMTQDPVALTFDSKGRLYVAETARRGTVDIDMRSHRSWLLDDLASDDFTSMRDFFQSQMATSRSAENASWLKDRNQDGKHDYRDLRTVSERIRVIEDTDGDGVADKSTVYAESFNEEFNGVLAGVMPYRGDVLATVYPDLWRLRDTDDDNKADRKEIMFRGFGVHAAFDGHDLHGLTVGPEGKIYFSCGDNGFSIKTQEGNRLHYPNTGGVLRMDPDGSNLEVFAYGLRNVQEFDFDQYGNMFAVDNDGDLEDERERAVYIAEGSDSGWRLNWQFRSPGWKAHNGGMTYNPWTAEGMWRPQHIEQPANITPPMQNYSVGPGGFKFNPGTALNDEYRDFFFCVQFPVKKVTAFRTRPVGAGFEMVDEHTFNGGLMVSSVNFGPDGGCYLADWVGKWSPNNEGIIYRVDDPNAQQSAVRVDVKRWINEGVGEESNQRLLELLGHPDRRVRQLAQFELVDRRRGDELLAKSQDTNARQLARIHALWGILQLNADNMRANLASELPWNDTDYQVRQQCCRVAGDLKLADSQSQLIRRLEDPVALVRSHAAIALGKVGTKSATQSLLQLLQRNTDLDPFIRHAAVTGLAGAATETQLAGKVKHESKSVRLGAVLALGRQKSSQVSRFLDDEHHQVVREAARAIHDDFSIVGALPDLAKVLDRSTLPRDEPTMRRVISANFRIGNEAAAKRILNFILSRESLGDLSVSLKLEALDCLAAWNQSPIVDRVEGRIRKNARADLAAGRNVLQANLERLLATKDTQVSAAVLRHLNDLKLEVNSENFRSWVTNTSLAPNARIEALRLLREQKDEQASSLIDKVVHGPTKDEVWRYAFALMVEDHPKDAIAAMDWDAPLDQQQLFLAMLPKIQSSAADKLLQQWVERVTDPNEPTRNVMLLDVLAAARQTKNKPPALPVLEKLVAAAPHGEYSFSKTGGNATRGEQIYRNHPNAQCVRCHNAGGQGRQAGPVLTQIGTKPKDYLLAALVAPSDTIAKGFESVTVVKEDGKMITGTVVSENDEVLMLGASNKNYKIRKDEIEERIEAKQSAMPKMSEVLSAIQIRDVVEYLSTLR